MYVLVTGAPAAGKTTVARALAAELGLPLLAKDTVKGALIESLGAPDVAQSRRLGAAAVDVLLAVAGEAGQGVLDSVWVRREAAVRELARLPGRVVEVCCRCEPAVMEQRYADRAAGRGPGHFDRQRSRAELWPAVALTPLGGPWPLVEVDTTAGPVAADRLALRVRAALSG